MVRPRRWRVVVPATLGGVVALALGILIVHDYRATAIPEPGDAAIDPPTVLLDATGKPARNLEQAVIGERVSVDTLPDHVVHAVLAGEDRGFWGHPGFSARGMVRAVIANVRSAAIEQGASTITQQYVDLTTPGQQRSYRSKFREVVAAVKYERQLGKQEILNRYLNVVPFGRDTTGIDAAAQVYFGIPAADLDVNQAATLAGMIAAPTSYDPEDHPEAARQRRDVVLRGMGDQGWLEPEEAERLLGQSLPEVRTTPLVEPGVDAYFADAVRRRLEEILPDHDLSRGLTVHTTLDPRIQRAAQEELARHVASAPYTGAVVTIDPATGAVRALVGGSDYAEEFYNAAIRARRQPGSAFKPFTLAEFVNRGWSPDESEFPAPRTIEVETPEGEIHEVENFDGESFDELTVREATERSVNTVYMQMIEELDPGRVARTARMLGLRGEIPAVPSLTLGTASVSPLHMASAYATLAAGGVYRDPHVITRVVDTAGQVLYEHSPMELDAVSQEVAGVVTDVLEGVVERGTGQAAAIEWPVAGKTGTTDDSRDAWFVGFTRQLATSVWVGMADNTPMGDEATGGSLAAPIWADVMGRAMRPFDALPLLTADGDGLKAFDDVPEDTPSPTPSPSSPSPTATPTPSPSTSAPESTESESTEEPTETETATEEPTETETATEEPTVEETTTESAAPG